MSSIFLELGIGLLDFAIADVLTPNPEVLGPRSSRRPKPSPHASSFCF